MSLHSHPENVRHMSTSFTLAILPDTQHYAESYPHIFTAQTQWIVDNREERNIVFALHEGDITNGNTEPQWQNAAESMRVLDGGVPYAIVMGNHDMGPGGACEVRDSPLFSQHFPVSRYDSLPTFGGTFEPDRLENAYHRFEASGTGWLIVALEYMPRDRVLEWANDVIASHADRHVVVLTHSHVYTDACLHGSRPEHDSKPESLGIVSDPEGANDGQDTWTKMLRRHAKVRFVFNGHFLGSAHTVGAGNEGNAVYQMLSNYQHMEEGGSGYLRLIRCDPAGRSVSVKTYSPYLDSFLKDPANEFTIEEVDFG